MKVDTVKLGILEVDESKVIEFKEGLLGFENLHKYVLISEKPHSPFFWMQSLEKKSVAFLVINPFLAMPEYSPALPDFAYLRIEVEQPEDVMLLSIVTVRRNPVSISVNLRAPLAINTKKRIALQVVLENPDYPVRFYLSQPKPRDEFSTGVSVSESS